MDIFDVKETFKVMFSPLGIMPRIVVVDYVDKAGKNYNQDFCIMNPPTEEDAQIQIIDQLRKSFEGKGYSVCIITELLNGYTHEEFKKFSRKKVIDNTKLLYLNPKYFGALRDEGR